MFAGIIFIIFFLTLIYILHSLCSPLLYHPLLGIYLPLLFSSISLPFPLREPSPSPQDAFIRPIPAELLHPEAEFVPELFVGHGSIGFLGKNGVLDLDRHVSGFCIGFRRFFGLYGSLEEIYYSCG